MSLGGQKSMAEEQKKVGFVDSSYMIEEMISQFEDSNHSALQSTKDMKSTIDQLKSIKSPTESIKSMIKALEGQLEQVNEACRKNAFRADCLRPVLMILQKTAVGHDGNVRFIVSMLLEAIGAVNRDCKPFEERDEIKAEKEEKKEA